VLPILVKTAVAVRWQSDSMSDSLTLRGVRTMDRDRSHALFGQTMG
jgi:hypothetical protein